MILASITFMILMEAVCVLIVFQDIIAPVTINHIFALLGPILIQHLGLIVIHAQLGIFQDQAILIAQIIVLQVTIF